MVNMREIDFDSLDKIHSTLLRTQNYLLENIDKLYFQNEKVYQDIIEMIHESIMYCNDAVGIPALLDIKASLETPPNEC